MKKPISYFLGEGLLIVFSILLALGVSGWRQWAGDKAEERRALASIHAEMGDNLEILSDLPEYHVALGEGLLKTVADIEAANEPETRTAMDIFMGLRDIQRSSIVASRMPQGVAWELAKQRGVAARFDYDLAKRLSLIYGAQEEAVIPVYEDISKALSSPQMFARKEQTAALSSLAVMFLELGARERSLVDFLGKTRAEMLEDYPQLQDKKD